MTEQRPAAEFKNPSEGLSLEVLIAHLAADEAYPGDPWLRAQLPDLYAAGVADGYPIPEDQPEGLRIHTAHDPASWSQAEVGDVIRGVYTVDFDTYLDTNSRLPLIVEALKTQSVPGILPSLSLISIEHPNMPVADGIDGVRKLTGVPLGADIEVTAIHASQTPGVHPHYYGKLRSVTAMLHPYTYEQQSLLEHGNTVLIHGAIVQLRQARQAHLSPRYATILSGSGEITEVLLEDAEQYSRTLGSAPIPNSMQIGDVVNLQASYKPGLGIESALVSFLRPIHLLRSGEGSELTAVNTLQRSEELFGLMRECTDRKEICRLVGELVRLDPNNRQALADAEKLYQQLFEGTHDFEQPIPFSFSKTVGVASLVRLGDRLGFDTSALSFGEFKKFVWEVAAGRIVPPAKLSQGQVDDVIKSLFILDDGKLTAVKAVLGEALPRAVERREPLSALQQAVMERAFHKMHELIPPLQLARKLKELSEETLTVLAEGLPKSEVDFYEELEKALILGISSGLRHCGAWLQTTEGAVRAQCLEAYYMHLAHLETIAKFSGGYKFEWILQQILAQKRTL